MLPNGKEQSPNTIVKLYTNVNASTFFVEPKTGEKNSTKLTNLEYCHFPSKNKNGAWGK